MKRREIERFLKDHGYALVRSGNHNIWSNGLASVPVPHHTEFSKYTAKDIMKQALAGKTMIEERKMAA